MRPFVTAALVLACVVSSPSARADDTPDIAVAPAARAAPPARPRRGDDGAKRSWYGWQILIADGAVIVLAPALAIATEGPGGAAGFAFFLTGPLVHAAHGEGGRAAASFGVRLGLTAVGAAVGAGIGAAVTGGGDDEGKPLVIALGAVIGGALGVPGAIAIDAAVVARDPDDAEREREARRRAPPPSTISWSPSIVPRPEGGVSIGLVGAM